MVTGLHPADIAQASLLDAACRTQPELEKLIKLCVSPPLSRPSADVIVKVLESLTKESSLQEHYLIESLKHRRRIKQLEEALLEANSKLAVAQSTLCSLGGALAGKRVCPSCNYIGEGKKLPGSPLICDCCSTPL